MSAALPLSIQSSSLELLIQEQGEIGETTLPILTVETSFRIYGTTNDRLPTRRFIVLVAQQHMSVHLLSHTSRTYTCSLSCPNLHMLTVLPTFRLCCNSQLTATATASGQMGVS